MTIGKEKALSTIKYLKYMLLMLPSVRLIKKI